LVVTVCTIKEKRKIMITFEQVEKLRKHTGISYEDAKALLEKTNGDLLEAVIHLEKENLIHETISEHTTSDKQKTNQEKSTQDSLKVAMNWIKKVLQKGNSNRFEVVKNQNDVMVLPITVLVILVILGFSVVVPIMIIALFFGYSYRFAGPDFDKTNVNQSVNQFSGAISKAATTFTDEIKRKKDE